MPTALFGQARGLAERSSRGVDVGQMHLDEGNADADERVAQRDARGREAARVDDDEPHAFVSRGVDAVDQRALVVALEGRQPDAATPCLVDQARVDVGERVRALDARARAAEQIQVRPVQDQDRASGRPGRVAPRGRRVEDVTIGPPPFGCTRRASLPQMSSRCPAIDG